MIDYKHSVTVKLATRLTLFFTLAASLIVYIYTVVLWNNIKKQKQEELTTSSQIIQQSLRTNNTKDIESGFLELSYYIDFSVFSLDDDTVIQTNNEYIPHLGITNGKIQSHKVKDYFGDSDLNIFYIVDKSIYKNIPVAIQVSVNMDSDSATNMFKNLPWIISITLIPIIILAFISSALIAKKTTEPLKRELQREKQFTSDVSHELRTPIAVISGQANLLKRWGKDDPVQVEKSLSMIITEVWSMEKIISNLLQMSRLERGTIKPDKVFMKLDPMLERLQKETLSINPDVKFTYNTGNVTSIFTDEELIHQVFTIIISNTLKYCDNPIEIHIDCKKDNAKHAVIRIIDNGKGFEDKVLPHVFERIIEMKVVLV